MCLTQSHSCVFPFIKTRGGCVCSEVHVWMAAVQYNFTTRYTVDRNLYFGSSVNLLSWPSVVRIRLSYVKGSLAM